MSGPKRYDFSSTATTHAGRQTTACHRYPPHCKVFLILHERQNAVRVSKFSNKHSSILHAHLSHPFKPCSCFEILSLPTLICVAILPVLWRPLFFFSPCLLFGFPHTPRPIFCAHFYKGHNSPFCLAEHPWLQASFPGEFRITESFRFEEIP